MRIEGKRQQQHEKEVAKQREHAQQVASDSATLHHQRTRQLLSARLHKTECVYSHSWQVALAKEAEAEQQRQQRQRDAEQRQELEARRRKMRKEEEERVRQEKAHRDHLVAQARARR